MAREARESNTSQHKSSKFYLQELKVFPAGRLHDSTSNFSASQTLAHDVSSAAVVAAREKEQNLNRIIEKFKQRRREELQRLQMKD
eukprot:CAMPEP_0202969854 /NCGR_PEP_ID=MMETSP1396-20130829/15740_1 /ASSEMBLY_ACC=CAM_ASM_000872 /TAXON_ID= /ORGANISM="Pseudokeronopsis sp., Strain Brazil" /LENGTH=85 /DNA_ID=CAMNT_0049697869 /DNA_START=488 /DNA_END=745 /DNA_ORIENTATION=-